MTYVKITLPDGDGWIEPIDRYSQTITEALQNLADDVPCLEIKLRIVEMTEAEYEALPEFQG